MTEQNGIPQISVADLADDTLILDVREPNEYAAGHAPGAVSIPLGEVRARLAEVPASEGRLAVICKGGVRSQKAAEFLASQGLAVRNIVGGTTAWDAAGKPLVDASGQPGTVVAPSTPPPAQV